MTRPLGFNKGLHMDLKYHKDALKKKFVGLSAVCQGTSWHVADLLKTRAAAYVGRKFVKTWIRHYGVTLAIVHDQGGEFQGDFVTVLEDNNITA